MRLVGLRLLLYYKYYSEIGRFGTARHLEQEISLSRFPPTLTEALERLTEVQRGLLRSREDVTDTVLFLSRVEADCSLSKIYQHLTLVVKKLNK